MVTNSIPVADVFYEADLGQTVLLTGGLRTPSDALVGPVAVAALTTLHVDCCSWASTAWTRGGLHHAEPAWRPRPTARWSPRPRRLVVVADHTKWGIVGLSRDRAAAGRQRAGHRLPASPRTARTLLADRIGEVVIAPLGAELRGTS